MKKIFNRSIIVLAGIAITITFAACEKDKEELGRQAAEEFCDCLKNNSKSTCESNLKSKYTNAQYTSMEFINAFNESNTCGATLTRTTSVDKKEYPLIEIR